MKKTIAVLTLLAVTALGLQTASAGDREWATAGKVLTGLVAAHVVARAFEPAPVYTTAYVAPPPVYVQPAPTVVYQQPVAQPQVVYQQPVYAQPAPVYYVQPAPVFVPGPRYCYAPPFVSFSFGFGHGFRSHNGHRW
jgi:hypothetical protein